MSNKLLDIKYYISVSLFIYRAAWCLKFDGKKRRRKRKYSEKEVVKRERKLPRLCPLYWPNFLQMSNLDLLTMKPPLPVYPRTATWHCLAYRLTVIYGQFEISLTDNTVHAFYTFSALFYSLSHGFLYTVCIIIWSIFSMMANRSRLHMN